MGNNGVYQREPAPFNKNDPRWLETRAIVLARDTHCHLCGEWVNKGLSGRVSDGPNVDHIIPKSRGGAYYDAANAALAHKRCNQIKWNKMPEFVPDAGPSRDWLAGP
ncbi:MAG: HNH endonuclease [Acidimicrobiales bacterium]